MAELSKDLKSRTAAGRVYLDPETTFVGQGTGGSDPGALTNSLTSTTTDGVLETMTGLDTVSQNALSRNLSELNAKIDALRTALLNAGIVT